MITELLIGSDRVPVQYLALDGDAGRCDDAPRLTISIRESDPDWQKASTILHEAIHAIDFRCNLKLTEEQVQGLEPALRDLIRQNPQLIDALRSTP